eukprot:jgi/Phyca11/112813/e_gw1.23.402.1
MMADPSSCFVMTAEEQKAFQIQHGEKYIQLKNYTDQLEAELRETKTKMQALTTSNDELRECKTLKAQPSVRQFPSPTRSTMAPMHMQQHGEPPGAQASQFSRPSMRPLARPYAAEAPNPSMRNTMLSMGRPKTPRQIQRPNVGIFERFSRPQIGSSVIKNSDRATENPTSSLSTGWIPLQKKPSIVVPAPAEPAIPFDSETILKMINSSPVGHSRSQIGLTSFTLELAELHDLTTEATTDGHTKQGTELQTRSYNDKTIIPFTTGEAVNTGAASPLLLHVPLSRASISLGPLKATPQTTRKAFRSPAMRSSRVAQRYQLRHPDDLIAEASERRRIADEVNCRSIRVFKQLRRRGFFV